MYSKKGIEDFKIIANIDKQIIRALKKKIGINERTDRLATTIVREEPNTELEGSYEIASVGEPSTLIPFRNIHGSAYIRTSFVSEGVNQHLDNDYLFISLAPENVHTTIASQFKQRPLFEEEADEVVSEAAIAVGEIQARDTFASIRNKHPEKNITVLVLGNPDINENISVYRNFCDNAESLDNDGLINKYVLGDRSAKTKGLQTLVPEDITVTLCYLPVVNSETERFIGLSSCTLETLYQIYRDTIASENPLLIHCDNGLDRAAKIAFAFEILRNYDQIFNSTEIPAIAANLNSCFDRLRRSRSPHLLSNAIDLSQAFQLALALKAVDLQFQCKTKLNEVIEQNQNNTEFTSTKLALESLLEELKTLPNDEARARNLQAKFYMVPELSTHFNLKSLPLINSKLRSNPEYYELLKDLKEILTSKIVVEQKVFIACNTEDLASKLEEKRVKKFNDSHEDGSLSIEETDRLMLEEDEKAAGMGNGRSFN